MSRTHYTVTDVATGEVTTITAPTTLAALTAAGFGKIDYLEARDAGDLSRLGPGPVDQPARVLVAAWLGKTRLIDNMEI